MSGTKMRELSLFSGGGGGILASHLLGWDLQGCAEWDAGARSILESRMADGSIPSVTIHEDVQTLDPTDYIGKVNIVTGGFPCQPFSNAGKKMGENDPRNMWPHTVRILKGTKAPYGYFENVASLLSSGYFGTVLKDLIEAGFHVSWDCVPASAVGAPHIRARLWIFARKAEASDPKVTPGSLPLLTVATLDTGSWQRTTGAATWSETDDLGEPEKWPRAGVAIGNIVHAIPRSGFPQGVRKYGVWPMARLPWAPVTDEEEATVASVWPTPMAANGSKSSYTWRTDHQNDLNAAVANPERHWATPTAVDAKNASLPPSEAGRDGVVGDVMRAMGAEDKRRGAKVEWSTPTTMDTLPPKSQEVLDREATETRVGRSKASNLRDQVNVDAGNVEWKGQETFPTPTASERSGINPNTGKGGGLTHEIKQRDMYPTPLAGENRKSAKSLKRTEDGGQSTPPGLAQHAELQEGIIPREYEGVPYDELPPKVKAMWPTPRSTGLVGGSHIYGQITELIEAGTTGEEEACAMFGIKTSTYRDAVQERWPTPTQGMHKQDVNDSGEYAQRVRDSGFQEMLPVAVKLREGDEAMWPTPRAANPGSRPNGKGGKVLSEEVQISEGERERGEYVDGTQKWPTPSAMDGARRGKAIDPDHWLEARDRHAENGVNKHFSLDVAVAFEVQGRDPKEKVDAVDAVDAVAEALAPSPVEEMFEGTLWPTPNASRGLKGGSNGSRVAYERLVEQGVGPEEAAAMVDRPDLAEPSERWPTPLASDWKGANLKEGATSASASGLASTAVRRDRAQFQTPTASDAKAGGYDGFSPLGRQLDAAPKKAGLLNPEWVAWLMGWPVGWTSPNPMPEGGLEDWKTQNQQRTWWKKEPEDLPRLTQKHETAGSRTVRLKALGNGQVSLCCARSYEVLQFTLDEVLAKVKEGESEVSMFDFLGL